MKRLNYTALLKAQPTLLDSIVNQRGQKVDFVEHPTLGCEYPIIAMIHEFNEAVDTGFFDTSDFYVNSDYNPVYMHGEINCAFNFDL
jgi:hypothetical protein